MTDFCGVIHTLCQQQVTESALQTRQRMEMIINDTHGGRQGRKSQRT